MVEKMALTGKGEVGALATLPVLCVCVCRMCWVERGSAPKFCELC